MSWRKKELSHFAHSLSWLDDQAAELQYARANAGTSKSRYGLDEKTWRISDRWDVEEVGAEETDTKLRKEIPSETFFVVFGQKDVCRVGRDFFIANWRDMFCPSRDDVVLIPDSNDWCVFYCHEDEFEAGTRMAHLE